MKRILIDLSAAQGDSSNSGIGKYSYSLCLKLIKKIILNGWKPIVILNNLFSSDAKKIRRDLSNIYPELIFIDIYFFDVSYYAHTENLWRYYANIEIRNFINYIISPDYQFIPSFLGRGWIESNSFYNEISFTKFATGVVIYDDYVHKYQTELNIPERLINLYLSQIEMLRSCKNIFSISEFAKNSIMSRFDFSNDEIITIYGGSDLENTNRDLPQKPDYISSSRFFLVVLSSFDYRKNLEVLIRALSEIPIDYLSDTTILITGNINNSKLNYYKNIIKSFNLSDNLIKFVGFISNEDLINLYKLADLLIVTSRDESLCLPLLSAIEFDTPAIAPKNSVFLELLKDDIFLYEDDDPISLSDKIKLFLCDSKFKPKLRSEFKQLKSKFNWNNTTDIIIASIKKVFLFQEDQQMPISNLNYHDLHTSIFLNSQVKPSNFDHSLFSTLLDKNLQAIKESLKI